MFSKSLFKQSCKANGLMWTIITVAVCFMLCCVMLIAGNGELGETKVAIEDAVVQGELTSETESRAINYYEITDGALKFFDTSFSNAMADTGNVNSSYAIAANELGSTYYAQLLEKNGYSADSVEGQELKGVVFYAINPPELDASGNPTGENQFDKFFDYESLGVAAPDYKPYLQTLTSPNHEIERAKYAMTQSSVFLAGNMVKQENVELMLAQLKEYGITQQKFHEFGFDKFDFVKSLAENTIVDYRANLQYRLDNNPDNKSESEIKTELAAELSAGLLASLPDNVADALKEIGAADLYGTLVGSIFFKMAGLLLPIIYMIMTSNALVAGQVDSGSMAYVLSSGTKRKAVVFTQAVFLISSIFAMFVLTTITSVICLAIVDVNTGLTYGKLLLINLGAFLVMFAMSGICFLTSCVFNRSKNSMALGGGLNMFFLVATMLGLFGSPVLPSIIRMKALNAFNYVSLISLFDVVSILEGGLAFLWKLAIPAAVGTVCYIAGSLRFEKKDLPL